MPSPGEETPAIAPTSVTGLTGTLTCPEPRLVWRGADAIAAVVTEEQFAVALSAVPPVTQLVVTKSGCDASNGRITSQAEANERVVGRVAFASIDTACGSSWSNEQGQLLVWLEGEAPADYPELVQGYQLLTQANGMRAVSQTLVLTSPPAPRPQTCADALRFYPGRPPVPSKVCRSQRNEIVAGEDINAALAQAGPGDRVLVKPGIYAGKIALKAGVELVSEVIGGAILLGDGVQCADDAALIGFVVTGGSPGIRCASARTRLWRNIVRGNVGAGIVCDGCTADISNNTVIGNLRGDDKYSRGIVVVSGQPRVYNNLVLRHDLGFVGDCEQKNNWLFDNRNPGRDDARLQDPKLVDIARDDFRLAADSPARASGEPIEANDFGYYAGAIWAPEAFSLAAQEYAIEALFNTFETADGLVSSVLLLPPVSLAYAVSGVNDQAIALFQAAAAETTVGVTQLNPGDAHDCSGVRLERSSGQTQGLAFTAACGIDNKSGGGITGGHVYLAPEVLDALDVEEQRVTVTHESGHAFGLYHVFRAVSPMAYGPRRADYAGVDKEALALRACASGPQSLRDWRDAGYIQAHALQPFPAVERVAQLGARTHLFGSRFTLRFGADGDPLAAPIVRFNSSEIAVDLSLTSTWHGGPTRNLEVVMPADFDDGWVSVTSRGLTSIPIWVSR